MKKGIWKRLYGVSWVILVMFLTFTPVYSAEWAVINPTYTSTDWWLNSVHSPSPNQWWAVGRDTAKKKPPMLQYLNGSWNTITPPSVSSDWWLSDLHFYSTNEGWAVGYNQTNQRGVLLRYFDWNWMNVTPPIVSPFWWLNGVYFFSSNEGWAVGYDASNDRGVLLHCSNGAWTNVSPPPYASSNWTLYNVFLVSSNEGWAVGEDLSNGGGVLLHYLNGTWTAESSSYVLNGIHFTSSNEGWAVGDDLANRRGGLLHYVSGTWTAITPPSVSTSWGLNAVHFTSSNEGWAVGSDFENKTGVLLHFFNGIWSMITPPYVSSNWEFTNAVRFSSPNEGWAVGVDSSSGQYNRKGILLKYLNEIISAPIIPVGPTTGTTGSSYSYSTGESTSNLNHLLEYQFDWKGDGTDLSPWSVATFYGVNQNFTTQPKSWASSGIYNVRGRARCIIDTSFVSEWSIPLPVTISGTTESITTPSTPSGPTSGNTGTSYLYSTGGATSNLGHSVEYQFDWKGDGSDLSPWGSESQSKSWSSGDTYNVRARARCAIDNSVISNWSGTLSVTINQTNLPDLTGQWNSLTQTCQISKCTLKGKFTIQNIGNIDASSCTVKFYLSDNNTYDGGDTLLRQVPLGTIIAGGSLSGNIKFKLQSGQTATGKYVIAVIDAENTVLESNEGNNQIVYGPVP